MRFTVKDALREVITSSNYVMVRPREHMQLPVLRQYNLRTNSLELSPSNVYEAKLDIKKKTISIHDHGLISDPVFLNQFNIESELNSMALTDITGQS